MARTFIVCSYKDYITALDKLLRIMADFHSVSIFKILLPICIQETDHVHAEAIQQSIAKFAQGLKKSQVLNTLHKLASGIYIYQASLTDEVVATLETPGSV